MNTDSQEIGIPLYGRAFEDTKGLGDSYDGVGPGTIQAGIYSYNALPLSGAAVTENQTSVASYSYDSSKEEFVSYDTPTIANMKAHYVIDKLARCSGTSARTRRATNRSCT